MYNSNKFLSFMSRCDRCHILKSSTDSQRKIFTETSIKDILIYLIGKKRRNVTQDSFEELLERYALIS